MALPSLQPGYRLCLFAASVAVVDDGLCRLR